ncbi:hypothetical protein [Mesoplasma photuris]|uniref:hypothetical protein n=1 Tax=Mesoplasma photuris TaxID=217731 RepID=UPI0004E21AFA|nr:hypothetical protein [Mesoplasma photuris]
MSKDNNNNEIELGFFEPGLALVIANLELLEEELIQEKSNVQKLTILLDKFSEVDDLNAFDQLVNQLDDLEKTLRPEILNLIDVDRVKLISYLDLATTLANNLKTNGELISYAATLEDMIAKKEIKNDEEIIFDLYKDLIIKKVNDLYVSIKPAIDHELSNSEEFKKVINIMSEEKTIQDLIEGSELLFNMFGLEEEINDQTTQEYFKLINEAQALITMLNFWEQDDIDEEE